MEIVKVATEWAKDEIFSSKIFILCGILFVIASIGFWQLGKTDVAKAFIYPTLVVGIFLLMAGVGFFFSNKARLSSFEADYKTNPSVFVETEIARTKKTIGEYQNVALKVFPAIIAVAALLMVFVDKPIWRAICITVIALMVCMVWIDMNAKARIEAYHQQLISLE